MRFLYHLHFTFIIFFFFILFPHFIFLFFFFLLFFSFFSSPPPSPPQLQLGTKASPATTCKDLFQLNPDLSSGWCWCYLNTIHALPPPDPSNFTKPKLSSHSNTSFFAVKSFEPPSKTRNSQPFSILSNLPNNPVFYPSNPKSTRSQDNTFSPLPPPPPPGIYWIDPNQGSIEDALEVQCNKVDQSTCIQPTQATISKGWRVVGCGGKLEGWVRGVCEGFLVWGGIKCLIYQLVHTFIHTLNITKFFFYHRIMVQGLRERLVLYPSPRTKGSILQIIFLLFIFQPKTLPDPLSSL